MIDLAELKRLALASAPQKDKNGYYDLANMLQRDRAYHRAANPATILSLIQRVEEADADRELFATPIAILQERARNEALEEAAKIADEREAKWAEAQADQYVRGQYGFREGMQAMEAKRLAQAIRALKEKA